MFIAKVSHFSLLLKRACKTSNSFVLYLQLTYTLPFHENRNKLNRSVPFSPELRNSTSIPELLRVFKVLELDTCLEIVFFTKE